MAAEPLESEPVPEQTEALDGPQEAPQEADPPTDAMTPEQQAQARVECVQEAADLALADGATYVATVPQGTVSISKVTSHTDGLGAWWVDVWLAGAPEDGEPSYRIYNPPLLVEDPEGTENVGGVLYRLDPMAALAQVIGLNGGATRPRKR